MLVIEKINEDRYQMLIKFHIVFVLLSIVHYASTTILQMKPSFVPYCISRDKCKPACTCEVKPNCTVLNMNDGIRNAVLYYHNQIRNIQGGAEPQPGGMTALKYDLQLEEVSKCWASRCDSEYSECFVTEIYPETSQIVGQIHVDESQTPNIMMWIQMINFWLGQTKSLTAETINSLPAGEAGLNLHNYAQMMSDQVKAVGCAWSVFENILTFVCTYGPKGPLQGEAIYRPGAPCTLCPKFYQCDYEKPFDKLCKEIIQPDIFTSAPPSPPPKPPHPTVPASEFNLPTIQREHVQATGRSSYQYLPPDIERRENVKDYNIQSQLSNPQNRSSNDEFASIELSPSSPKLPPPPSLPDSSHEIEEMPQISVVADDQPLLEIPPQLPPPPQEEPENNMQEQASGISPQQQENYQQPDQPPEPPPQLPNVQPDPPPQLPFDTDTPNIMPEFAQEKESAPLLPPPPLPSQSRTSQNPRDQFKTHSGRSGSELSGARSTLVEKRHNIRKPKSAVSSSYKIEMINMLWFIMSVKKLFTL